MHQGDEVFVLKIEKVATGSNPIAYLAMSHMSDHRIMYRVANPNCGDLVAQVHMHRVLGLLGPCKWA